MGSRRLERLFHPDNIHGSRAANRTESRGFHSTIAILSKHELIPGSSSFKLQASRLALSRWATSRHETLPEKLVMTIYSTLIHNFIPRLPRLLLPFIDIGLFDSLLSALIYLSGGAISLTFSAVQAVPTDANFIPSCDWKP